MTTNAQAALLAAASTMARSDVDVNPNHVDIVVLSRTTIFLEWLNRQDEAAAHTWTPVIVPTDGDRA